MESNLNSSHEWTTDYTSQLTPELLKELNETNMTWFDDLTEQACTMNPPTSISPKIGLIATPTSTHGFTLRVSEDLPSPSMPGLCGSSPFAMGCARGRPEVEATSDDTLDTDNVLRRFGCKAANVNTPNTVVAAAGSKSTPQTASYLMSTRLAHTPHSTTPIFSPWMSKWDDSLHRLLMLKTPSSLWSGKPGDLHKPPGLVMNESSTSWTSSMATPASDTKQVACSSLNIVTPGRAQFTVGAARKLFSPGMNDGDSEETTLNTTADDSIPMTSPRSRGSCEESEPRTETNVSAELEVLVDNVTYVTAKGRGTTGTPGNAPVMQSSQIEHHSNESSNTLHAGTMRDMPQTSPDDAQSRQLNLLGDLLDTPPSQTSIRKPAPKKRGKYKQNSAPCAIIQELCEDPLGMEPLDRRLEILPGGNPVQNLSLGFIPAPADLNITSATPSFSKVSERNSSKGAPLEINENGDISTNQSEPNVGKVLNDNMTIDCDRAYKDSQSHVGKELIVSVNSWIYASNNDNEFNDSQSSVSESSKVSVACSTKSVEKKYIAGKQQADDMFLTQLSQSALNAIYEVADEATDPDLEGSDLNTTDGEPPDVEDDFDKNKEDVLSEQKDRCVSRVTRSSVRLPDLDINNDRGSPPRLFVAEDPFTQMSPGALTSFMKETDQIERMNDSATSDHVKHPQCKSSDPDSGQRSGMDTNKVASQDIILYTPTSPVVISNPKVTSARQAKLLTSKPARICRGPKQFSYPTTSQILSVCPKNSLGFQSETKSIYRKEIHNIYANTNKSEEVHIICANTEKSDAVVSNISTKPSELCTKLADIAVKPTEFSAKTVDISSKPVYICIKSIDVSLKPVNVSTKPVDTSTTPVDISMNPVDISTESVTVCTEPVTICTKPVNICNKQFNSLSKPVDISTIPVDIPTEPLDATNIPAEGKKVYKRKSDLGFTTLSVYSKDSYEGTTTYSHTIPTTSRQKVHQEKEIAVKPLYLCTYAVEQNKGQMGQDLCKLSPSSSQVHQEHRNVELEHIESSAVVYVTKFSDIIQSSPGTCITNNDQKENHDFIRHGFDKENVGPRTTDSTKSLHPVKADIANNKDKLVDESNCKTIKESCKYENKSKLKIELLVTQSEFEDTYMGEVPGKALPQDNFDVKKFVGFTSASGKDVNVKDDAVKKFAKWFEEDMDQDAFPELKSVPSSRMDKEVTGSSVERTWKGKDGIGQLAESSNKTEFKGFQTAGGTKITVSETSAAKFASWFEEAVVADEPMPGFQTAAGKSLAVSSATLAKFQNWFEDGSESANDHLANSRLSHGELNVAENVEVKCTAQIVLKTANRNDLSVSKVDIARFSKGFAEDGPNVAEERSVKSKISGFQTATGKGFQVSRKSEQTSTNTLEENTDIWKASTEQDTAFVSFIKGLKKMSEQKLEQDYSKLPKGFRPFKRPRMSKKAIENDSPPHVQESSKECKNTSSTFHQKETGVHHPDQIKVPLVSELKVKTEPDVCGLDDTLDNFTCTQLTEVNNCAEAFLATEGDTSFTQVLINEKSGDDCGQQKLKGMKNVKSSKSENEFTLVNISRMNSTLEEETINLTVQQTSQKLDDKQISQCEEIIDAYKQLPKITNTVTLKSPKDVERYAEFIPDTIHAACIEFNGYEHSNSIESSGATQKPEPCPSSSNTGILEVAANQTIAASPAAPYSFGFQTANGRSIVVSEESLQHVRELMQDTDQEQPTTSGYPSASLEQGSSTPYQQHSASVNPALQQEHLTPQQVTELSPMVVPTYNRPIDSPMRITARAAHDIRAVPVTPNIRDGKSCKTSFIEETNFNSRQTSGASHNDTPLHIQESFLRENVNISLYSSQALEQKPLHSHSEDAVVPELMADDSNAAVGKVLGFQSVSGKNVHVSSEDLQKVKGFSVKLPSDNMSSSVHITVDAEVKGVINLSGTKCGRNPACKTTSPGFSTANEQCTTSISFSNQSLKQVKELLVTAHSSPQRRAIAGPDEIVAAIANNSPIKSQETDNAIRDGFLCSASTHTGDTSREKYDVNDLFIGSQTAEGMNVALSEKALKRVQGIFTKDENDLETESPIKQKKESFVGFQTVNESKVAISETAFKQVHGIFKQDMEVCEEVPDKKLSFMSFQLASGSKVTVPETMVNQVKGISKDYQKDSGSEFLKEQKQIPLHGFQTARRSKVSKCDAALCHVKGIFNDDNDLEEKSLEKQEEYVVGLKTAIESRVTLSEPTLKQFQEIVKKDELVSADGVEGRETPFMGFQTASGSKVSISETSFNYVQGILNDDQNDSNNELKGGKMSKSKGSFLSFQSAEGLKASISKPALNEFKGIFNDKENYSMQEPKERGMTNIKISFMRAQTASGSKSSISEFGMNHVKENFNNDRNDLKNGPTDSETVKPKAPFMAFQTAAGLNVPVTMSETALSQVKEIFKNDGNDFINKPKEREMVKQKASSMGFQTAGGSKMSISETALNKVKGIFNDNQNDFKNGLQEKEMRKPGGLFMGFQTAGGSKVTISETALQQVQEFFKEDEKLDDEPQEKSSFMGFQTAGGSKVVISENVLNKVKGIFNDGEHDSENGLLEKEIVKPQGSFMGFQTAGGSKVTISETALQHVQEFFKEDEKPEDEPQEKPSFMGFQTAGGSKVISETALQQVQEFFQEDEKPEDEPQERPSFMGFQTAGGSKVTVSENALNKVKGIFNVDQHDSENRLIEKEMVKSQRSIMGFQTAGGSKVTISETALQEVQSFFKEVEKSDDEPQEKSLLIAFQAAKGSKVQGNFSGAEKDCRIEEFENQCKSSFMGFQTAGGSKVEISENALKKVQEILGDDQLDNVTKSSETDRLKSHFKENVAMPCKLIERTRNSLSQIEHLSTLKSPDEIQGGNIMDSNKGDASGNIGTTTSAALGHDQREYHNEEILLELSESSKAFLADGPDAEFEEEVLFADTRRCPRFSTSTPVGSTPKAVSRGFRQQNALGSVDRLRLAPRMGPVTSTPEGFFSDRCPLRQSLAYEPIVSTPEKEVHDHEGKIGVSFRWNGPRTYKAFSYPTPKRNVGEQTIGCPTQGKQPTPNKPTNESSFATPYRKVAPQPQQGQVGMFSTPVRGTSSTPTKAFSTPVKGSVSTTVSEPVSSNTFKTPVKAASPTFTRATKRAVSETEFNTPTSKKQKAVGRSAAPKKKEENVDGGFDDEWEMDQDSLTIADIDKLETDAVESDAFGGIAPSTWRVRVSEDVVKARMKVKVSQALRIKKKKESGGVRPQPGMWYRERCTRKAPLRTALGGWTPQTYSRHQLYAFGLRESTLGVTATRAENYRFWAGDFYDETVTRDKESVRVGDGAVLVWDDTSTAGKEEFCNALLDLDGVDPRLTDREWVYNHYRWIVWKLAALEVAFPQVFGGRKLTPDQVMLQLKYRYDREVDNVQRGALKKIYERDDTPAKALVLCVSAIISLPGEASNMVAMPAKEDGKEKGQPKPMTVVELTDGWYPIKAVMDPALTRLIISGRVRPGTKLCVCGAELIGSQDAAPPLQATADTMLKISANSCRRARWDTRLGYHSNPQPPPLPLCSLFPDGGQVGCVDVVIARVYPVQYMERTPGGSTVFRSERADDKLARRYEAERQRLMEHIYTKLQTEFEKRAAALDGRRSRRSGRRYTAVDLATLSSGQEMDEAAQAAADPASVEDMLTDSQRTLLTDFRRNQQEELHREMEAEFQSRVELLEEEKPKRNVVLLIKIRIAGCSTKDIDTKTDAVLTIWRPAEDVLEMLTEGKRFHIYSLGAAEARGRLAGSAVSLTAQRMTRYHPVYVDDNFLDIVYEPREVVLYAELVPGFTPLYGEVDAVGVVIRVSAMTSFDKASGDEGQVQTVYLADDERNLVSVTIWGSITTYCLEELLKPSTLVSCANLQWRAGKRVRGPLPELTLSETTFVSTNPKEPHLRTALDHLRSALKAEPGYVEDMKRQLHTHMTGPYGLDTPGALSTTPHGSRTAPQCLGCLMKAQTPVTTPIFQRKAHQQSDQKLGRMNLRPGTHASPMLVGGQGHGTITTCKQGEEDGKMEQGRPQYCEGDQTKEAVAVKKGSTIEMTPQRIVKKPAQSGDGLAESTLIPLETTPCSVYLDEVDVDPLVVKKQALQRMKARRLSMFADDTPVTPLNSNASVKARKAFKTPTTVPRSASPALHLGFSAEASNTIDKAPHNEPKNDQLGRKLSFEDEEKDSVICEKDPKRSKPCVGLRATSRKKSPNTLPSKTQQTIAAKTIEHTQPKGFKGSTTSIPQTCDIDDKCPGAEGLLGSGKPERAITELSETETVAATSSSVGGVPAPDVNKPTRTRGRPKRQLSSDSKVKGRQTKRLAPLGPHRKMSADKK